MSANDLLRIGFASALLAVLVLAAGCGSGGAATPDPGLDRGGEPTTVPGAGDVVLGAADNGSQVDLSSGQVLAITLESNPTTGYRWELSQVDEAVLSQVGEAEFRKAPTEGEQVVGAGGTETLRFAAATGETTLTLVYHRPWEEDVEPLETFTVQVVVR
jgi:inhibitor of cysteine peptidase